MRRHSDFKLHILKPYLKKFVMIDIISVIPLYFIDARFLLIKILRNFHIPRCFYSIRILAFKIAGAKGYPFLDSAKMWLTLILAIHLLSCIWLYIGLHGNEHPTWIEGYDANHPNQFSLNNYINAFFFLITTASTVGFGGDLIPHSSLEMLVCMFFMLSGLVLIGFFQGKVEYMIQNSIARKSAAAEVSDDLERWLLQKEKLMMKSAWHVDQKGQDLMNRILNYFKFYNANNVQLETSTSEFFEKAQPNIKDEIIAKSLHGIIEKFHIFFTHIEDRSFQKEIILHLKPKLFMPFQKIISRGHHPAGIYFILNGYVVVYSKGGEAIVLLSQEAYFGDSVLVEKYARYDVCSGHEETKCLFISRKKFLDICSRYPKTTLNFLEIAKNRINFEKESFRNLVEALKGNLKILLKPFNDVPSLLQLNQDLPSINLESLPKINRDSCNYLSIFDSGKHEVPLHRPNKFLSYIRKGPSPMKKLRFSEITELQERVETELKLSPNNRLSPNSKLYPGTIVDLQKLKFYSQMLDEGDYSYSEGEEEEAASEGDENDDASEKSISDGEDELNNSLEVPLDIFEINEDDPSNLEETQRYFEEKLHALNNRLDRIKKEMRHKTMEFWKDLKQKKKRHNEHRDSELSLNTHDSMSLQYN